MTKRKQYRPTTRLVHGPDRTAKWDYSHHVVPPLTSSTTYRLDSAARGTRGFEEFGRLVSDDGDEPVYIYERLDEPTRSMLEGELAELESGEACIAFASGMAAISAALGCLLLPGDEVIAHSMIYGGTHALFTNWYPRQGIGVRQSNLNDARELRAAITDATRVIYFESPTNPTLELVDIAAVRSVADEFNRGRDADRRILIYVDNTFATPFGQRPLEHGADVVLHSLTKSLSGFGTEIGGAAICPEWMHGPLMQYRRDFGGMLPGKSAWTILVYGLPTLALRLKRQQYSALQVAQWLESNAAVTRTLYPGLASFPQHTLAQRQQLDFDGEFAPGSMLCFELDPRRVSATKFVDQIASESYSLTLAVSLGHTKTLVELPAAMSHAGHGGDSVATAVRLSIGLESPRDIISDLAAALEAAQHLDTSA